MPDSTVSISVIRDGATAWIGRVVFADGAFFSVEYALDTPLNDEAAAMLVLEGMVKGNPLWFWNKAHGLPPNAGRSDN